MSERPGRPPAQPPTPRGSSRSRGGTVALAALALALGAEESSAQDQIRNFRLLYHDLITSLPNISYADEKAISKPDWMDDTALDLNLSQDMGVERRANMIRRLPKSFREKVYFLYQRKYAIPGRDFQEMLDATKDEDSKGVIKKQVGGDFDRRIAAEKDIPEKITKAINQTVKWPSTVQSAKGIVSAGPIRAWKYLQEKREKGKMKS